MHDKALTMLEEWVLFRQLGLQLMIDWQKKKTILWIDTHLSSDIFRSLGLTICKLYLTFRSGYSQKIQNVDLV
jgi:hypothetical protein